MSHNVYKVAIQMARTVPSLKEVTGVTGNHILRIFTSFSDG